jgi:hypothetical protein
VITAGIGFHHARQRRHHLRNLHSKCKSPSLLS